jgi:hypothetical protein
MLAQKGPADSPTPAGLFLYAGVPARCCTTPMEVCLHQCCRRVNCEVSRRSARQARTACRVSFELLSVVAVGR